MECIYAHPRAFYVYRYYFSTLFRISAISTFSHMRLRIISLYPNVFYRTTVYFYSKQLFISLILMFFQLIQLLSSHLYALSANPYVIKLYTHVFRANPDIYRIIRVRFQLIHVSPMLFFARVFKFLSIIKTFYTYFTPIQASARQFRHTFS